MWMNEKVRNEYSKIDFEELADRLIDEQIEMYGVRWMIQWLADFGLNWSQLVALGFDEIDIADVIEDEEE